VTVNDLEKSVTVNVFNVSVNVLTTETFTYISGGYIHINKYI